MAAGEPARRAAPYDEALLRRELALFPDWYIAKHLQVQLSSAQQATLQGMFDLIVRTNLAQASVFVHRDYMPRNLMISTPNPAYWIFRTRCTDRSAMTWLRCFAMHSSAGPKLESSTGQRVIGRRRGVPRCGARGFRRVLPRPRMDGLQRHLKVLGIFARINYRDGKPSISPIPAFLGYVRHVGQRYDDLRPLMKLLNQLQGSTSKWDTPFERHALHSK